MPLAPALLSTITACFVSAVIEAPSARASWSVALPAANGTMNVTGRSGYLPCDQAGAAAKAASSAAASRARRSARRMRVMSKSPCVGCDVDESVVVAAGEMRIQRLGHVDLDVEQEEGQGLAVAVQVERVVNAAVEHLVEHEVHRSELRQQVARHL